MVAFNSKTLCALFASLSLLNVLVAADLVTDLIAKGRPAMNMAIANSTRCTKEKLRVRREWGDISPGERRAYISAVKCLMKAPSRLDPEEIPGAKSRFDDFVVIHMKNTKHVHETGNFLMWHRYFTYAYESALRNECGFNGTQPYWNWGRYAENPEKSPLFDGSKTSIGGQGKFIPHNGSDIRPAGEGGGCINSGPFKNYKVNLGPLRMMIPAVIPTNNSRADGYGYNPRCVTRDISGYLTSRYATLPIIANLITNHSTIASFQGEVEKENGVHAVGHFTVAGDSSSDYYTSPGDLHFYFHHAMIDLVYSTWQAQDFSRRQMVISGGTVMEDYNNTSPRATLEDPVDLDIVNVYGKKYKVKDLVSTVDGPFCYVYE